MDIERVTFPPTGATELKVSNEGEKEVNIQREVMDSPDNRPHPPGSRRWHVTQCHPNGCKAAEGLVHSQTEKSYYEILSLTENLEDDGGVLNSFP